MRGTAGGFVMAMVVAVAAIYAVSLVVCFLAAMWVCDRIVRTTGNTGGLRDLAEVVRAFWDRFRR